MPKLLLLQYKGATFGWRSTSPKFVNPPTIHELPGKKTKETMRGSHLVYTFFMQITL